MISSPDFPAVRDLFAHEIVDSSFVRRVTDDDRSEDAIGSWQPEPILPEEDDERERFSGLRQSHRGFEITSYTRIKQTQRGQPGVTEDGEVADQKMDETSDRPDGELIPGGSEYGTALHAIIEDVDFEPLRRSAGLEGWQQSEEVVRLVTSSLRCHGIDPRHTEYSARLVYTALTASVALGNSIVLQGFRNLERFSREVTFLYPYPERWHCRLDETPLTAFQIGRGYVKGTIDLLFEYEGRTYLVDWKTDILPDYSEVSLKRHFETAYALQSNLYVIALVKMLRAYGSGAYDRLFGGVIYCFLRAMESPGDGRRGILFLRPPWQEILSFEKELLTGNEYAGAPR
jgi:exodeoxyribonuclease V beta subunit